MDQLTIKAALDWQAAMGADEAIGEAPADWAAYDMPEWWQELKAARPGPLQSAAPSAIAPKLAEPPAFNPLTANAKADNRADNPPLQLFSTPTDITVQAQTLADLAAEQKAFDGLGLKKSAISFVFGEGNPESRIMLIGEGPGADEDKQGRPFVGRSGQLLDRMLAAIGLMDRTAYYITNVTPWRPPGNRTPTDTEIALLRPFLTRHIELVNPAVIVTLGGLATKALMNKSEGITRLRGKFLKLKLGEAAEGIPLLPMFHPAALLRNPAQKRQSWADLLALKKYISDHNLLK
jgi:uracil-DNA glycosylase